MNRHTLDQSLEKYSAQLIQATQADKPVDSILEIFFDVAKKYLSAFKLVFWRFSPLDNSITAEKVIGKSEKGVKAGFSLPLDSRLADFILSSLSHRPLIKLADEIRREFPGEDLIEPEARTLYIAALFHQTELLAGISLECDREPVSQKILDEFERYLTPLAFAYAVVRRPGRGTKRFLQMRLLHQITEHALMRLDIKDLLDSTARLLKNYFLYYNVYIFLYKSEEGVLELEAMAGQYENKIKRPFKLSPSVGCVGKAFRTKKTYYCNDTRTDPTYHPEFPEAKEALSEIAVPIMEGSNVLGVLDVQVDKPNSFDNFDIESMETLASEIATALTRAYDYEILRNYSNQLEAYHFQMEKDLRISEQIININLPKDFVSPYVDAILHFRAHHSIGGDIVILKATGDYCYVLLGDVSGHGISSALISISTYSFLNNLLNQKPTVETLTHELNEFWNTSFKELGYYATFFAGRLHNLTGNFEYVNCAHPAPIFYEMATGEVSLLKRRLPPIGLFELDTDADIQREWIKLTRGDVLVFHTDGLLREYPPPSKFSADDLIDLVIRFGNYPHAVFHQLVLWSIQRATKGVSSADDEVFLTVNYTTSPTVSCYIENVEHVLSLTRRVMSLGLSLNLPSEALDAINTLLEETALALLARAKETELMPRLFVEIDFQPRKFVVALIDGNLILRDENMFRIPADIKPLEEQLPKGSLKLIKGKFASYEIKKIDKGLIFVYPLERAISLVQQ